MNLKLLVLIFVAVSASAAEPSPPSVTIAGKKRTLDEVESMIRGYAKRSKIHFDFEGAKREVNIYTNPPAVFLIFKDGVDGSFLMGYVDKRGKACAKLGSICGGCWQPLRPNR